MSARPKPRNPYLANIHWGQVVFGALAALLGADLYGRVAAGEGFTMAVFLESVGLVALAATFFFIYLPNMYRYGLMPDYSLLCRYCHGPVNRYSEFCEHCGGDLIYEEALIKCPKCSVDLYEGTKHCPECGATILSKKGGGGSGKGKKSKKKQDTREAQATSTEEGWDTPLDAGLGPKPWER